MKVVHWKSVLSRHMRWRITASFLATAFLKPMRFTRLSDFRSWAGGMNDVYLARCLPYPCIIKRTDHVLYNFLSISLRCLLLSHLTPSVQYDETIGDGKNIR